MQQCYEVAVSMCSKGVLFTVFCIGKPAKLLTSGNG